MLFELLQDSLLLLNWLCVDNIWNLMKKIVNASVDRSVPQTSFKVKRTAAAICVGRARKAVLRNTRYFMLKPAGKCSLSFSARTELACIDTGGASAELARSATQDEIPCCNYEDNNNNNNIVFTILTS